MVYRDDSSLEAQVADLLRRIRVLETQAPVGFTSVTRGALRVASNEGLLVEGSAKVDGWLVVTGTERVTGRLEGSGTLDWTGAWFLRGAGQITGNVTVLPGGKIQVGNIVIDPTISGGAVAFANGAQVFTDSSSIQMYLGNGVAQVSNTSAKLQVGGTRVEVTSGHVYAAGIATAPVGAYPGGFVGAIVYDGGEMKRLI